MRAVLRRADGWSDIKEFGRTKLDWLRRHVPLANGKPVNEANVRIMLARSVSGIQECFPDSMKDVVKLSDGEIIALDGKAHRHSSNCKGRAKALRWKQQLQGCFVTLDGSGISPSWAEMKRDTDPGNSAPGFSRRPGQRRTQS